MRRRRWWVGADPQLITIPPARRRRWPVAAALVLALGLVAAVVVVWSGRADDPDRLVAGSAGAVAGWRGVTYRGSTTDPDGITTAVRITVAGDGTAHGTLSRDFGAEAEIAVDSAGTLLRGNRQWWLTDQAAAADVLAGVWVADPPVGATGFPTGLPVGPSALADELARPGAQPWTEIGRETVAGLDGLLLSDGARRVVVSAGTPPRLLSVTLPGRDRPQVVPRAHSVPLPAQAADEPEPAPQYVEHFTIEEPGGQALDAAVAAAEAVRAANPGKPAPVPLGELLALRPGDDAETVALVNRLAARGIDARAAVPAEQYGKAVLQVLDAITADVAPNDPKRGGEFRRAVDDIVEALTHRQFAALHEAATNTNLLNPGTLRDFLVDIRNPDKQRHLQAVARLTAAGNGVRIEVPYTAGVVSSSIDWVIERPAQAGEPPSNTEFKRITGGDRAIRRNTKEAAEQLARFAKSEQITPGSQHRIELHVDASAASGIGRLGAAELEAELRRIDLYQACVNGGGGTCSVDRITVTTESTHEGKPVVVPHVFRPEQLRPDPPPGGAGAAPVAPRPDPAPDAGAAAPERSALFAGQDDAVPARGALSEATQRAGDLGGIDLSTLELRYLAERDGDDGRSVQYAFSASPVSGSQSGSQFGSVSAGAGAAQRASDAFFVWLALPRSAFTVNLNPDEPDRIVDAGLGRTDAGRILLEADLQLKRTVAGLIHPDTPLGAAYWDEISRAGEQSCQSFRQWIVPAPAEVWADAEEMHILDAPLRVEMESEYLETAGASGDGRACPQQPAAVEERNEDAFRTMILPEVQRAVNESPEYAPLRQVYLSRVAAEWYRQRSTSERLSFSHLIDGGDVSAWPARQQWSPREVFDRYVESFTEGEFEVTRETRTGDYIETSTYVYGGVDWTQVTFREPSPDRVRSQDLSATVGQSLAGPALGRDGRVWLSSASSVPDPVQDTGSLVSLYLAAAVIGAGLVFGLRSWRRVRRANRDWATTGTLPSR